MEPGCFFELAAQKLEVAARLVNVPGPQVAVDIGDHGICPVGGKHRILPRNIDRVQAGFDILLDAADVIEELVCLPLRRCLFI